MDSLMPYFSAWAAQWPAVPMTAWVGLALLVAVLCGEWAQRMGLARTTGYWFTGALLGVLLALTHFGVEGPTAPPHAALPPALTTLHRFAWLFDVALGWVLVELGQRIDLRWLMRNRALAATAVLEFSLTWALTLLTLHSLGFGMAAACVAASLAAHSAPVLLTVLLPQWRAEGQVTERALHLGALNTVLTAVSLPLAIALTTAYSQSAQGTSAFPPPMASSALRSGLELTQPLWEAGASIVIGIALGWLVSQINLRVPVKAVRNSRSAVGAERARWGITVGALCLAVGLAQWLRAPTLIACLALGLSLRRQTAQQMHGEMLGLSVLVQVVIFLVAGASLPWLQWLDLQKEGALLGAAGTVTAAGSGVDAVALILALILMALRLVAKTAACTLTARWAGLRWAQGWALGLMMQPFSITGLVFWAMTVPVLLPQDAVLSQAFLLMLLVSDVLAPWAMKRMLIGMREVVIESRLPAFTAHEASILHTAPTLNVQRVDTRLLGS
jgi:Kef-type K+ transport system membrane component KefB